MAKKKTSNNESLIRKVIALGAAVIAFVFMFLETIAVKLVGKNIITGEKIVETEGVKISDFLFKEDYKQIREEFSTANTFLWIAFILVIVAVLVLVASLVLKNNDGLLAKVGAGVLVLGLFVACKYSDKYGIISMIIYGISMFFVFTIGALWRFCSKDKDSWTYNMFDHRRIFMLISATFTPFCLITIREVFDLGWLLFFISWFFTIIGIIFDLFRPGRPFTKLLNLACYICICASGGMIFIASIGQLHLDGYFWIVVGIICYMIGNVFHYFSFRKTNWYFIWYLFLIGGTISCFVSILNYVLI